MSLSLLMASQSINASDCNNTKTQTELSQCTALEFEREAARFDETYNGYLSKLTEQQRIRFANTQHAWREYRDLACDFESSAVLGGSAHQTVLAICLTGMSHARRLEIEALLRCPEGALNCPASTRRQP